MTNRRVKKVASRLNAAFPNRSEAEVREFVRTVIALGEEGAMAAWWSASSAVAAEAHSDAAKALDRKLAGLARKLGVEKRRILSMLTAFISAGGRFTSAPPNSDSGPKLFRELIDAFGEGSVQEIWTDFEADVRAKSNRTYRLK